MNLDPFELLGDLDASWLLLSLIPSAAGFVLFMYGKKRKMTPHLVAGLLLMVYPMVATTVTSLLVGGALIGLGFWYAVRQGY
ncbi:MAG: amino acid transport protein [Acidobacteria bacterium]|nr:amino acid transport protein [Acidobacteriota bacterium]